MGDGVVRPRLSELPGAVAFPATGYSFRAAAQGAGVYVPGAGALVTDLFYDSFVSNKVIGDLTYLLHTTPEREKPVAMCLICDVVTPY